MIRHVVPRHSKGYEAVAMAFDGKALLEELVRDAKASGPLGRVELASGFDEVVEEVTRVLGAPAGDASWMIDGVLVKVVVEPGDDETPALIALEVSFAGEPTLLNEPCACACANLKAFQSPFARMPTLFYPLAHNPSIRKTHVRVATSTRAGSEVALYRCRGCNRRRQTSSLAPCIFDVPSIAIADWTREPYEEP